MNKGFERGGRFLLLCAGGGALLTFTLLALPFLIYHVLK